MYEPTAAEKERRANTVRWREEQRQRRSDAWRPPEQGESRQARRRTEASALRPRLKEVAGKERRRLLRALRDRVDFFSGDGPRDEDGTVLVPAQWLPGEGGPQWGGADAKP